MNLPYDVYFSADIETDGPIPGPFSMLSFALVRVGTFDGQRARRSNDDAVFYRELRPISDAFDPETLAVSGLDRDKLTREGEDPADAMTEAAAWVRDQAGDGSPVLVAYPLSFDWSWIYWYFVAHGRTGSPFRFSNCLDIKTAFAIKGRRPIAVSGRSHLPAALRSTLPHSHHAIDDAREQGDIFFNIMEWSGDE